MNMIGKTSRIPHSVRRSQETDGMITISIQLNKEGKLCGMGTMSEFL